jgi:hypothetical protein
MQLVTIMKADYVFCKVRTAAYEDLLMEIMLFVSHGLKAEKEPTI